MRRAFTMMWCHYSPEWFDGSFNFPNCAVRTLDSAIPGWDGGGIFGGFNRCAEISICYSVCSPHQILWLKSRLSITFYIHLAPLSNGEMASCQPVLADPVQTQTNELYYKFCTETRYHPIRRSSKHSTMIRRPHADGLVCRLHTPSQLPSPAKDHLVKS